MSPTLAILVCVAVFCFVVVLCVGGYFIWQQSENKKQQTDRLESAINVKQETFGMGTAFAPLSQDQIQEKAFEAVRKDKTISNIPIVNLILNKFFQKKIQYIMHLIEQTGLSIKVGEFILFTLLLGFIGASVVVVFFKIPVVGFGIVFLPFSVLNSLRESRKKKFVSQLPQALDMMNSDLRSGLDIQQVFKHIAEELSPPISEEFQRMVAEVNLGVPVDQAILNLGERMDTMDVQMLCTGLIINRELGGNLAELVANVCATVRERFRLQGVIAALTAESKASSYLLLALPVGLYFLLGAMAPDTYKSFSESPLGDKLLKGCCVSMLIGFTVLKNMTKIEA